ncbi:MAG: translation elongation factor Ts, partial [Pseudomonadota bacterium]
TRLAAEGRNDAAADGPRAVLVEINSDTDIVAKDENFARYAEMVARVALATGATDVDALRAATAPGGGSVDEARQALVATCGEHGQGRRLVAVSGKERVASYIHSGRIGVLVEFEGGNAEIGRGVAMHVAAMNPAYLSPDHVPAAIVAKEKEIALAQISEKDRQKPADIQEKMISGKLRKVLAEISLTGQPYALDTSSTVEEALRKAGARVTAFHRIAVGEGIEKKDEDFAAEVMKQAGLA